MGANAQKIGHSPDFFVVCVTLWLTKTTVIGGLFCRNSGVVCIVILENGENLSGSDHGVEDWFLGFTA